jgi:hypothetical protein
MSRLFLLAGATGTDPAVEAWFGDGQDELRRMARSWFEVMRACGSDVRVLLHDGHPTVCVDDAAFGYVNAFRWHVNIGFFHGADLPDPSGMLEGSGKDMRHVKVRPGDPIAAPALTALIRAAYADIRSRLTLPEGPTQ